MTGLRITEHPRPRYCAMCESPDGLTITYPNPPLCTEKEGRLTLCPMHLVALHRTIGEWMRSLGRRYIEAAQAGHEPSATGFNVAEGPE